LYQSFKFDKKTLKQDVDSLLEKAGPKGKGFIPKLAGKLVFKALDKNGDGVLDGDEAFGLFKNLGAKKDQPDQRTTPEVSNQPQYGQDIHPHDSKQQNKYY